MDESGAHEASTGTSMAARRLSAITQRLQNLTPLSRDGTFHVQRFIEGLQIINKRGERVPLIMNRSQEVVFHRLMECREKRLPARFICLKARQLGISTLIEAFMFALTIWYANRSALVTAHSIESAQTLFNMARRFYQHLPAEHARPLSRSTTRMLEYAAPHYSRIQIATAANKNLGRGGTVHYVHASEVAFWKKPEEPMLAINQAVPRSWDTIIFWESTANGAHNLFHRTWAAAERGESDLEPIFLSWKAFPEYSLPVAHRERISPTPEERSYARAHGLSDEQLKWARSVRINQCHNSWDRFHQEYPIAPHLAFMFTGLPWFDQERLADMLECYAAEPAMRGQLVLTDYNVVSPAFIELEDGPLSVWKPPEQALTYSLGMDVGEGVGADYTVIHVLCNETREIVARYRSNRVRPEQAGVEAYLLGAWYNYGLLGIERNGPGLATLAVCERGTADLPQLTGYPNLYYQTLTDRKEPEETRRLGWLTTKTSKEAMLSRLAETFDTGGLTVFSKVTLLEMQGFVWDAEKRAFRQNYLAPECSVTHDDEIMALAIANEMRTHTWKNRFTDRDIAKAGTF
jgi:hypothetical protein